MKCKLNVGLQNLHSSGALTGGGRRRNGRHCPGVAYVGSLFFEPISAKYMPKIYPNEAKKSFIFNKTCPKRSQNEANRAQF